MGLSYDLEIEKYRKIIKLKDEQIQILTKQIINEDVETVHNAVRSMLELVEDTVRFTDIQKEILKLNKKNIKHGTK